MKVRVLNGPFSLGDLGRIGRHIGKIMSVSVAESQNPILVIIGGDGEDFKKLSQLGISFEEIPAPELKRA